MPLLYCSNDQQSIPKKPWTQPRDIQETRAATLPSSTCRWARDCSNVPSSSPGDIWTQEPFSGAHSHSPSSPFLI